MSISNSSAFRELLYGDGRLDDELDLEHLDAHQRTAEVKEGRYKQPSIYVQAFEKMVTVVYEGESHLFTEKELAILDTYSKLSYNARYCLVRLILRKTNVYHTVKSMEKFKNEVGEDGLDSAILELCKGISYDKEVKQEPGVDEFVPKVEIVDLTLDSDDEEEIKPGISVANVGPYQIAEQDIKPSLETLLQSSDATYKPDFSFFLDDETSMTLEDVLKKLSTDQLRELVKDTRIKPESMNKDAMVYALLLYAATQKPLGFSLTTKGVGKKKTNDGLKQTLLSFMCRTKSQTQTQESRLLQMALAKLGKSVRVNVDLYWLVARLNVIYERSTEYPKSLLVPSLLSSFRKRTYAEYNFTRDSTIWSSREQFMDYFEALRVEFVIETELEPSPLGPTKRKSGFVTPAPHGEGKFLTTPMRTPQSANRTIRTPSICKKEEDGDHHDGFAEDCEQPINSKVQAARRVKEVFDSHLFEKWKVLVASREQEADKARSPGLERFEPGFVYARILRKVMRAFATLKLYEEESIVLETLLAQRFWQQGKRARWYERLALLRMNYLCRSPDPEERRKDFAMLHQAMEGIVTALHDVDTHLGERLIRLEKQLKIPEKARCTLSGELRTAKTVQFSAERITKIDKSHKFDAQGRPITDTLIGLRTYFSPNPKVTNAAGNRSTDSVDEKGILAKAPLERKWKGKSLWRGRNGEEVNVECRALQYYETLGFKGFHSETRILTTLFSLLFWDILFADVPGAFETAYQTAPLDLAEDSFYRARKDLINKRLDEIKQGRSQEIVKHHDDLYRAKNTWCVGVRWDICTQEDLLQILQCLGGNPLATICQLFCEDYAGRSSGVPDLIVWDTAKGLCKFVEVKGPGDTPQENQKLWFHSLLSAGANVEICKVLDKDQPPKSSKKKSATRKAKRKREEDVVSEPEIDFDSFDRDGALDYEPYESPHSVKKCRRLLDENADVLPSIPLPFPTSFPSSSAMRRHNCDEVIIPSSPYRIKHKVHTP